uniref:Uncharacterized protein n=1 Tax=Populus trichocarpa TaxID=3694 RepID=A0A3N7ENN3_POPTR
MGSSRTNVERLSKSFLTTQRNIRKFMGPISFTRNLSPSGTAWTGRYFTQTKTTIERMAGRFVIKWEKMWGTLLASSE